MESVADYKLDPPECVCQRGRHPHPEECGCEHCHFEHEHDWRDWTVYPECQFCVDEMIDSQSEEEEMGLPITGHHLK